MFCQQCGTSHPESFNYCTKDGKNLNQPQQSIVKLAAPKTAYCHQCGTKNLPHGLFCTSCGISIMSIEQHMSARKTDDDSSETYQASWKEFLSFDSILTSIKKSYLGVVIAFAILFLLSFLAKSMVSSALRSALADKLGYNLEVVNTIQMMMYGNFVTVSGKVNVFGNLGNVAASLHLGILALFAIPILSLVLAGYITAKQNNIDHPLDGLRTSIGIGIPYAILLSIFSLFAGISSGGDVPLGSFGSASVSIHYHFSFFSALFHGLLFGIILSWLGTWIHIGLWKKTIDQNKYHRNIVLFRNSIVVIAIGVCISSLIAFIASFTNGESIPFFYRLLLSSQIGVYLWHAAHFNWLTVSTPGDTGYFHLFKGSMDDGPFGALLGKSFWVVFVLIANASMLFFASKNIKKISGSFSKNAIYFSIIYGFLAAFLASLTKISFGMTAGALMVSENVKLQIGFNIFMVFLLGTVVSWGCIAAADLIRNKGFGSIVSKVKFNRIVVISAAIVVVVILLLIGFVKIGQAASDKDKLIHKLEKNIASKNITSLSRMIGAEDAQITTNQLTYFADYLNRNSYEMNKLVNSLKNQSKRIDNGETLDSSTENSLLVLKRDGKKWMFFKNYRFEPVPFYLSVSTNLDKTEILVNNKQVATVEQDEVKEIGPYYFGDLNVQARAKNEYSEFTTNSKVAFQNTNVHNMRLPIHFDTGEIRVDTNYEDATIFVNANLIGQAKDVKRIGPVSTDSKFDVFAELDLPWGKFQSEHVNAAAGDRVKLKVFGINDPIKDEIMKTINEYNLSSIEALTLLDETKFLHVTANKFSKEANIIAQRTSNDQQQYDGTYLKSAFALDSFNFEKKNDQLMVTVDAEEWYEETTPGYFGPTRNVKNVYWRYYMVFDNGNWLIDDAQNIGWFDFSSRALKEFDFAQESSGN